DHRERHGTHVLRAARRQQCSCSTAFALQRRPPGLRRPLQEVAVPPVRSIRTSNLGTSRPFRISPLPTQNPNASTAMHNPSDEAYLPQGAANSAAVRHRPSSGPFRAVVHVLFTFAGRTKLRSKFLLSLALVTVALTAGTLLAVRESLQAQAQRQVEQGARNAL